MNIRAIIPAAGKGERIGADIPKQYISLAGVPILVYTLEKFQRSELVDEIVLVVGREDVKWVKDRILDGRGLTKVRKVIEGGKERQDSVALGLECIWDKTEDDDIVIIHDGARPFINREELNRCIYETQKVGACVLGTKIKETLKSVNENMTIKQTLPCEDLWIVQTPQAFTASLLKKAYIRAKEERFYGTDDASLVERTNHPIRIIPGSLWNIKITYPEDLQLAEQILKMGAGL